MRPRLLAPALAVGIAALAGCSVAPGSDRTAAEARTDFVAVLDRTQETLGGEWENHDDPTPRSCTIPLWVEGERYPGLRLAEPPPSTETALAEVRELWASLDYAIETARIGEATELTGEGGGELLIFRVSADGMSLQGESECRPL